MSRTNGQLYYILDNLADSDCFHHSCNYRNFT